MIYDTAAEPTQSLPKPVRRAGDPGYFEAVYAGVLGKIIGVYLGRPVENWTYERIASEVGDVGYFIHEQRGRLLVITDDDISGAFTFFRALEDYGYSPELTSGQIGQTWLNYLIENTTILWWGGLGNSTEHTAYLRLKEGVAAPASGSAKLNSLAVAEQIGAQIFIDAWGLASPGDPERAAHFARLAAQVSHDGEAVNGAVVVASLVAAAFCEKAVGRLLDTALSQIDPGSMIVRMCHDIQSWRESGRDWRSARAQLEEGYGYTRFPGQCPVIPNHGLILLSLIFGDGDFDESMLIVNTAGWDTDCNSGNVGTILGVRNGLATFGKQDWRGPVADRLYMPSADGGRAISDALTEAAAVANGGRALAGLPPLDLKGNARFHFSLPGSVQGWMVDGTDSGHLLNAQGSLKVAHDGGEGAICASTPTFIPPEIKDLVTGYVLVANPTLYPSQTVKVRLSAPSDVARVRLFIDHYNALDASDRIWSEALNVDRPFGECAWIIPDTNGYPIHALGVEVIGGSIEIDSVNWEGVPETEFPWVPGTMWARAWASSMDRFQGVRDGMQYLVKNYGRGFLTQGARAWKDYEASCCLTPRMAKACGMVVRYQGLKRHYAVMLDESGRLRIEKELDGRKVLGEAEYPFELHRPMHFQVQAMGSDVRVIIDGSEVLKIRDDDQPLQSGAMGLCVEDGCFGAENPRVRPL